MSHDEIPAENPRRRRLRRVSAAVVLAVAALGAPVLAAAPAGAVSQTTIHPEWVDGCGGCPGPLLKVQALLDERVKATVTKSFADGVAGLISASRTRDPAVAKRLHDTAIRTLSGGAAQAGNTAWAAGDWDGDLCPRRPWPFPGPGPQWDQDQRWLADGMSLLGRYNLSGSPDALASASRQLDAGATGLTAFQGCV